MVYFGAKYPSYNVVGQAMRQRRTSYVPTQSGRTRFRPRRSHRLVLSANIGMILRTQTPSAIGGHAHTDSFGQQRQKFYLVVGQAIRHRRTSYAGGAQVPPEADRLRRRRTSPTTAATNNGERKLYFFCFDRYDASSKIAQSIFSRVAHIHYITLNISRGHIAGYRR